MEKQLTMRGGQTPVQRYWSTLLPKVQAGERTRCEHLLMSCSCSSMLGLVSYTSGLQNIGCCPEA
jgi:hypothetical protein